MKKNKFQYVVFVFLFLALVHYCYINGLEKILFSIYANSTLLRRPTPVCETVHNPSTLCLGMPSGHVEIVTILGSALYHYNLISLVVWFLLIVGICLQRILTHRHTFLQTMVGILFGLFYSYVYLSTKNNLHLILLCVFFIFLYMNICLLKLNELLSEKIPEWVDRNMLESIEKKKNVPYYLKCISVFLCSFQQDRFLFIGWKDLEMYLDKIVDNIKKTGISFHAVVGIKTGGAIVSDYISRKLNLPNYKIKITDTLYKCNKTPNDCVQNYVQKYVIKNVNKTEYSICQEIQDNLSGKNVILIDECVSSGETMNRSIDYLISKEVNTVYPVTIISTPDSTPHPIFKLNTIIKTGYFPMVWAWGYDN
jgi:hypoxanthine phosphoribosyltransferase